MRALLQVTVVVAASIVQVNGSCTNVQCGTGATCAVGPLSCDWVANNLNTGSGATEEVQFTNTDDPAVCIEQCRDAPGTGNVPFEIASLDVGVLSGVSGECWCQYGNDLSVDPNEVAYKSCALSTMFTDGYTCSCDAGYEGSTTTDGPAVCTDIDGCDSVNCGANASCEDVDAPGTGYTCVCDTGYGGTTTTDGPATCIPDEDCDGTWSECTDACEAADDRTWTETAAQVGGGAACPTATACAAGDGACPVPDADCAGTWSECTDACEAADDRTWTETAAQVGGGAACPTATACAAGDGACPTVEDKASDAATTLPLAFATAVVAALA